MASNVRNYIDQTREEAAVRLADDVVDTALQTEIDQIETSVGLNADGTFSGLSGNFLSGSTLGAAIQSLDAQVKTNDTDINTLGDPSLMQTEIDAIETGAGLSTAGVYSANNSTNYLKTASSLKDADEDLDAQIKINTDGLAQEIFDRGTAVTSVNDELTVTQAGAGLLTTGAYSPNGAATYIPTASSLKDADDKLDVKLKSVSDDVDDLGTSSLLDILGIVSETGGIPTGSIIESGTNSYGYFVKYADGTMLIGVKRAVTVTSSVDNMFGSTAGAMFYGDNAITFPATFIAEPFVVATETDGTTSAQLKVRIISTTGATIRIWGNIDNTEFDFHLLALGRWF